MEKVPSVHVLKKGVVLHRKKTPTYTIRVKEVAFEDTWKPLLEFLKHKMCPNNSLIWSMQSICMRI